VYSLLLNGEIREDTLLPGYFFHGEETFLADEFAGQLRDLLASSSGEDFHVDRFYLDETKWMDIIDTARTVPFLFHAWRLILVRFPERKPGADKGGWRKGNAGGEEEKAPRFLGESDQKIIRAYFADPAARTTLVVLQPGKVRRNDAVVRFFSSLAAAGVLVKEVKPLYPDGVRRWVDRKAQSLGKSLTEGTRARLLEIVGNDLRLLTNELEKLAVFVGEKRGIDEDDVNQATGWLRSFETYELDDVLTSADFGRGVSVLSSLFSEGEKPEVILARLAAFFRNVLTAQAWLREKSLTRDEIFQHFFPYIVKTQGEFYRGKLTAFFSVVEGLSRAELNSVLRGLQKADVKIKTTDTDEQTALEIFLKEYCLLRGRKRAISRG
jgi:DNA polymerase III delta subunit